jgi:hypothetical protein
MQPPPYATDRSLDALLYSGRIRTNVLFIGDKGTGKSTLMKAFLEHWHQNGYVPEQEKTTFATRLTEVPGGASGGEGTLDFIHYGKEGATGGPDMAVNRLATNYFSFTAPELGGKEFAKVSPLSTPFAHQSLALTHTHTLSLSSPLPHLRLLC